MFPFFCFGGNEKLTDLVFADPAWITEILTKVGPECTGFLPWRRTALHLFIPDDAYNNFIHTTLRKANPNIYILGEVFYGRTALDHNNVKWWVNYPKNCSGVMLTNLGYKNINIENILAITKKLINSDTLNIIIMICGETPYYATKNNNLKSFKENLLIKHELETRSIKAGFNGFITSHDDMSNGIYNKNFTNNICK